MDFIFMLTRNDRTVEDAARFIDVACDAGVAHVGFKDAGIDLGTMKHLVHVMRRRHAASYFEIVATTAGALERSLATGRALGVDFILGGSDLASARRILGNLSHYFPFAGKPVGHPTLLDGTPARIAADCAAACEAGCGGVDLLAYRATEADPLELVRAARTAWADARLIVAGSIATRAQVDALARAGANAFTVGSAVFDRVFAPELHSVPDQLARILDACQHASRSPPRASFTDV